ncbi:MAG: hypothetical protein GY839_20430 [candidate division Zixibacteria bacterium]|nr:hypothetical protein [candidate division Zixibacteria bacterium]
MDKKPGVFKRLWHYLKPPMSLKEAKQKGLRYFILIILFYTIRDVILYIIIPLSIWKSVAD